MRSSNKLQPKNFNARFFKFHTLKLSQNFKGVMLTIASSTRKRRYENSADDKLAPYSQSKLNRKGRIVELNSGTHVDFEDELQQNGENLSPNSTERLPRTKEGHRRTDQEVQQHSINQLCGKLQKLVLKNFMNHRHLEVPFGDKINFITGKNGSGKSAIVTALLIGLGARASLTQRGSSIKGLIRKGELAATISIYLSNVGRNPFQPDVYGPTIVIERRITQSATTYKVKSSKDRVIGTTAHLMHRVLEHFDICIDNPTTILTQDMSREFLASAEPYKLYSFFKQATRLDLLEQDLMFIKHKFENAQECAKRDKVNLERVEAVIKNFLEKIKACESKQELDRKKKTLQAEIFAVQKKDLDAKKYQLERKISEQEAKIIQRRDNITRTLLEIDNISSEQKSVQAGIDEVNEELKNYNDEKHEKDIQLREKNREANVFQISIRSKETAIKKLERDISDIEKKASEIRAKNQSNLDQQKLQLQEKFDDLANQIEESRSEAVNTELSLRRIQEEGNRLSEELRTVRQKHTKLDSDLKQLENRKRQLNESKGNSLKTFGFYVPDVLAELKRSSGLFSKMPKGPLGMHIKATETEYEIAIEQCLGQGIMTGFLVDNRTDGATLRKIFDRVIGSNNKRLPYPQIFTQRFIEKVYETSRHKSQTNEFPTLQEVIQCSDAVIMNCILDQVSPENILVFMSLRDARRALIMNEPPPKTTKGICTDGSEVLPKKAVYSKTIKDCRFFQRDDLGKKIASTQENLDSIKREMSGIATEMKRIETECSKNKREHVVLMREKSTREHYLNMVERSARDVKRKLEEMVSDESIEVYESEIVEETQKLSNERSSLEQNRTKFAKLKEEAELIKNEVIGLQQNIDKLNSQVKKKVTLMLGCKTRQVEKVEEKKFLENSIAQIEKMIQDDQEACKRLEPQISDFEQKIACAELTQEQYARILRSRRSKADIEKALAQLKTALAQKVKEVPENREELDLQLGVETDKYTSMASQIAAREEFLLVWQDAIHFRETKYVNLRENATVTMSNGFSHRLALRKDGHSGRLVFDHDEKTLNILVKTAKTDNNLKNNSQLSGGERSFTTVCFITAMWSAVSGTSPFKV